MPPPLEALRRAGIDGPTLLYERHTTQLTIKLCYNSPYVEDDVSANLIPLSYAHFSMPLIGFLFNLDGQPREIVNCSGGASVSVAIGGNRVSLIDMGIGQIIGIMQHGLRLKRDHEAVLVAAVASVVPEDIN
jgi:hypothetical protein